MSTSLPGKRIRLHRWLYSDEIAARVEVDAVIPDADPSEPCFEAPTMQLLDRLRKCIDAGDVAEVAKYGAVYKRQSA